MAEPEETEEEAAPKRSNKPLLIGFFLALVLGGGGFYAVWSGLLLAPADHAMEEMPEELIVAGPLPDVVFVPIQPLVVNIGSGSTARHLLFRAELEVKRGAEGDVNMLLPRVTDVLNSYLRAVDISELERRTALIRLRAQMLRRVQVVTGEGRVNDLLIMEFVIN